MSPDETLIYEARMRRRQAIVAGAAAVLYLVAAALQLSGPQAKVSELTVQLITIHKRFPIDIVGSIMQAAALGAFAWTLTFLFTIAKSRKPDMAPAVKYVAIVGAAISGLGGIFYATVLAIKSNSFVGTGSQTYQEASHLTSGALLPIFQTLDIAAQFALELGLILITLNAMRVGLLTKFLGYCGIVVGVAGMLLIGSPPAIAIQIFWLGAIAYLFSGRWPGGDPPAWKTGRAEHWPTMAEMRDQRDRAVGGGRVKPTPAPEAVAAPSPSPARTRAASSKRKRKRRN
jgi:hypothetical protein